MNKIREHRSFFSRYWLQCHADLTGFMVFKLYTNLCSLAPFLWHKTHFNYGTAVFYTLDKYKMKISNKFKNYSISLWLKNYFIMLRKVLIFVCNTTD